LASPPRIRWNEAEKMLMTYHGPTDIPATPKGPGRTKSMTWEKLSTYFVAGMPDVGNWTYADRVALAHRAETSESTVRRLAIDFLQNQGLSELSESLSE
jgi:hypothetical protein